MVSIGLGPTPELLGERSRQVCDHPLCRSTSRVDAAAVIARTGFFVLCSVFKEHLTEKAGPELGALCCRPFANPWAAVRSSCSGLHFALRSCSPERRATLAGPPG